VLLAAGLEGFYGAFQYLTGSGPATFAVGEALRAYGHFEQPNPFAGYLATVLPLALVLALRRPTRPLTGLALFALVGASLGILLSQSRGAWLGTALALAVMLLAWSPRSRAILGLGLLALPAGFVLAANRLVPASWTERLASVVENFGVFDVRTVQLTSENFALVERMAHWQAGWYMFLDHPLLGVGAGNYPAAYEEYALPGWREALGHAHNYYLNMAAETGLVGLVALVLLLAAVYRLLLGGLRRLDLDSHRRALLVGLLGSVVVLTVHNFFDNLLVHGVQVQIGFLLGLATLLAAEPARPEQSRFGPPSGGQAEQFGR
jgi:O-antigen ligase